MTDDRARASGNGRRRGARALYEPVGPVLVRAPVLPVEAYLGLAPGAPPDPLVRTALAVGSRRPARRSSTAPTRQPSAARATLLRYLIRMSTRPTPYGLFAAVGSPSSGERDRPADRRATAAHADAARHGVAARRSSRSSRPGPRSAASCASSPTRARSIHGGRALLAEPRRRQRRDGPGRHPRDRRGRAASLALARTPVAVAELADELLATPRRDAGEGRAACSTRAVASRRSCSRELRPPLTHPARRATSPTGSRGSRPPRAEHAALGALLDAMRGWDAQPARAAARDALRALGARATAAVAGFDGAPSQVDAALTLARRARARDASPARRPAAAELLLRVSPAPVGRRSSTATASAFIGRYGAEREVAAAGTARPGARARPAGPRRRGAARRRRPSSRCATRRCATSPLDALRERRLGRRARRGDRARTRGDGQPDGRDRADVARPRGVRARRRPPAAIDAGEFALLIGPEPRRAGGRPQPRPLRRPARGADAHARCDDRRRSAAQPGVWRRARLPAAPRRAPRTSPSGRRSTTHEIVVATMPGVDPRARDPARRSCCRRARRALLRRAGPARRRRPRVHAGHMLNPTRRRPRVRFLEELARDGRTSLSSFHWGAARRPAVPAARPGRPRRAGARPVADRRARCATRASRRAGRSRARWPAGATAGWSPAASISRSPTTGCCSTSRRPTQAGQLRDELRRLRGGGVAGPAGAAARARARLARRPGGRHLAELVVPLVAARAGGARRPAPPRGRAARRRRAARDRLRAPGSDWLFLKLYGPRDDEDDAARRPRSAASPSSPTGSGLADALVLRALRRPRAARAACASRGEPEQLVRRAASRGCASGPRSCSPTGAAGASPSTPTSARSSATAGRPAMDVAETLFAADSAAVVELLRCSASCRRSTAPRSRCSASTPCWLRSGSTPRRGSPGIASGSRRSTAAATTTASGASPCAGWWAIRPRGSASRAEPALERVLAARGAAVAAAATRLGELERVTLNIRYPVQKSIVF